MSRLSLIAALLLFVNVEVLNAQTNSYRELKLFIDADQAFVQRAGSEAAAVQFIHELVAQADAIFRKQLGMTITLIGTHLWSGSDTFDRSNQSVILSSFAQYAENNYRTIYSYDVAHLLVGQGLSGEGGIAYSASACGDFSSAAYAYGVSQPELRDLYQFNAHLLAHELGHNLAAEHDAFPGCAVKTIMCAAQIGGTFSDDSVRSIGNYLNSRTTAGCFSAVTRQDPGSSLRLVVTPSGSNVRYQISGAQDCTSLTVVGSPSKAGLSVIFGYLQIGKLTPAASVNALSRNVMAYRGRTGSKLYLGVYCDGQLAHSTAVIEGKRQRSKRITSSAVLALRSLQKGFKVVR